MVRTNLSPVWNGTEPAVILNETNEFLNVVPVDPVKLPPVEVPRTEKAVALVNVTIQSS